MVYGPADAAHDPLQSVGVLDWSVIGAPQFLQQEVGKAFQGFARLVEATGGYLRYKRSGNSADWFRMRVPANLKDIHALMQGVPFNDAEEESMCKALRRILSGVRSWRVQEKARE